jgi:nucleotide-binding universal stress UspA family protein
MTEAGSAGIRVVLAIDGSPQSESAFEWYVTNLHREGNVVYLVHAMEAPSMPTRDSWDSQIKEGQSKCDELKDKFTKRFKELKIIGHFIYDVQKPGELVCSTAKKEDATFIVMGTRGLGKIRRTILGSVSDYVVHHAHCPVTVCRFE